ncbi:Gfo/Idh/MocA family protein [Micromonospora sp. KC721]|uniref:Gfo/Idh/MocA family protein n=1 Tax=Micromonospora sp. KC721 TaxID=2530380 RepID=UPI0010429A4F|nr:Gfo/Idh/MocA family oxidoreductase [Micromonospora sp. KC721]TDB80759.1 Gfo/Idh/MocA family oxidoreductase [Micromonospora sp. KC721]
MVLTPGRADQPTVVLVGAHGYGRGHLQRLACLHAAGRLRLVGVADPRPLDAAPRALAGAAVHHGDAAALITAVEPDLVVISTPVHNHVDLALLALRAGAHVLLEKPPAPTLDGLARLLAAQRDTGRVCQVGFQAFGSAAVGELTRQIRAGVLGRVRHIGVTGLWWRDDGYWSRSAWAGRRWLDGRTVNDGALTNPFAHGVALALRLDGSGGDQPVGEVELDTYRTRAAQAHDTATARVRTALGTPVTIAVTLCAPQPVEPVIEVFGSAGTAVLHYTEDRLRTPAGDSTHPRTDLLENLLDHLADPQVPLLVPLADTLAFTQVAEAVHRGPAPVPVGQESLADLPALTRRAARTGRLYRELGVDWARAEPFRWTPPPQPPTG